MLYLVFNEQNQDKFFYVYPFHFKDSQDSVLSSPIVTKSHVFKADLISQYSQIYSHS